MTKLSQLFTRKTPEDDENMEFRGPVASEDGPGDIPTEAEALGPEAEKEASVQLGRACEALRNLIVEAGCKLNELEETKQTFFSIVDPAAQALRTLEHEKTRNISLTRRLGLLRASAEALQAKYDQMEKRAESLANDKDQLRAELEEAQRTGRELRAIKAELTNDLVGVRATAASLEHQVTELASRTRSLTEDNQRYRMQAIEMEANANALDADLTATRENLAMVQGENRSLQNSLNQSGIEISELSQRSTQTETTLAAATTRIRQLEASLSGIETERDKLVTEVNSLAERERNTQAKAQVQLEALQARAGMAEKLLANTRQLLATRNEEARASEREVMEAKRARAAAESLRREIESLLRTHENHIKDLETSRAAMTERNASLADALKQREAQFSESEEQRRVTADQMTRLENEMKSSQRTFQKRIDELLGILDRERLDRQVVESALDTARRERAQLQHELYKMRRAMQRGRLPEEGVETAREERSGRSAA
ncbi:MAG TPA: hypothetical protein VKE26_20980 [Xanthobacteraceae bacterium]|nr:hypothetical protein [Xanthobacteraceae bacterium]